jgi:tetratricopeptide (TPR) repeat protein
MIFFPIMITVITIAGITSFLRLPVWNNSETLWKDALEKSPTASRSYFNLSGYYFDKQQYDKVIPVLEKYVSLEPFDYIGYGKLRQTYYLEGRYHEAAHVCKTLIAMNPTNQSRYIEAGLLYERMNLPDSAIIIYKQGYLADSTFYELLYRSAIIYDNTGRYDEAEYYYAKTLQRNNTFAPAYFSLGRLYAKTGRTEQAIQVMETGVSLAKPFESDLFLLRDLYRKTKQEQKYFKLLQQLGIQ